MSILTNYVNAPAMRQKFYELNGFKYASCWGVVSHNHSDGKIEAYQVALCSEPGVGIPESPMFDTPQECKAWAEKYCSDLPYVDYEE